MCKGFGDYTQLLEGFSRLGAGGSKGLKVVSEGAHVVTASPSPVALTSPVYSVHQRRARAYALFGLFDVGALFYQGLEGRVESCFLGRSAARVRMDTLFR